MNRKAWCLSPIFLAIVACGGGSDVAEEEEIIIDTPPPGKIAALELPEEIAILLANDGDPVPKRSFKSAPGDFDNDEKRVHVWDEAMEPLTMVNEILCYVGQTGADQIVNETYTALVDTQKCRTETDDDESTGQSSGNTEEFQLWTIESTRESNDAPQTVKIWVPAEGGGDDPMDQQRILVEVTIDSEGDENNPYGQFVMNWKGVVDFQGNDVQTMHGTIQAAVDSDGKPNILFFDEGGSQEMGFTFSEATNILLDDVGANSGVAKTSFHNANQWGEFGAQFSVAYNADLYLRGKDTDLNGETDEQMCLSRTEFDQYVWRYNLYHANDGSRVEINSGFPFFADIGDQRYFGHVGYWGIWLPNEVDINEVTQITQQDFENDSQTVYDVLHAPGKLIKRTKSSIPLEDIEGSTFQYGDLQVEYTHDFALNDGTQVGETGFYAIAAMQQGQDGQYQYQPITPYQMTEDHLFFWSEALGGGVNFDAFHDATVVTVYQESYVRSVADLDGDATSLTLDCYHQCLKSNISPAQVNEDGDTPYLQPGQDPSLPTATYTFNFETLTLQDSTGSAVALADNVSVNENSPHHWGLHTGAMLVAGSSVSDGRDVWNAEVSYVWETGHNHWNKTSVVFEQGTGVLVTFDKPMNFVYNHTTANDLNATDSNPSEFDGQSFMLNYGGDGDLWGIPHEQNENGHHFPLFSLKDGTTLGDGAYQVKGIDVEQRLRAVDVSECSNSNLSLDATANLALPDQTDITPVTINWSDKPEVTDSPRVIGGEVQG